MTGIIECTPALFITLRGQNLKLLKCFILQVCSSRYTVYSPIKCR